MYRTPAPDVVSSARMSRRVAVLLLALTVGCPRKPNAYEDATASERAQFKRVRLPLPSGTSFYVSQGAFGAATHGEKGNEYQWDFDVPYGTPVVAVEAGTVIDVWEPRKGGGCDSKFNDVAHNVKVRHSDGTVAQYVHVESRVRVGDQVAEAQPIAITAENGFICRPQLHFGVYRSAETLYDSPKRESIPLRFVGLVDETARQGARGVAP
jgi:murein DD-endopeptidase MepM/ murein hydrolase activator NlpD